MRLARFLLLVVLTSSAFAAPAAAERVALGVAPEPDVDRELLDDRPLGFLTASVTFPAGRVDDEDPLAVTYVRRRPGRCPLALAAFAGTSRWPGRIPGHTRGGLALTDAGGTTRRLPTTVQVNRARRGTTVVAAARLPAAVTPAYPQRLVYVSAVAFKLRRGCPPPPRRALLRILATARFRVTAAYAPPPPTDRAPLVGLGRLPHLTIGGPRPGALIGWDLLASVGDVTGDGRPDLAIDERRGPLHVVGVDGPGRIDLARGGSTTLASVGPAGTAAGLGDVDGDAVDDLLIAQPDRRGSRGRVLVLRGGEQLGRLALRTLRGRRCAQLGLGAAPAGSFLGAGTATALTVQHACGVQGARLRVVGVTGPSGRFTASGGVTLRGFGAPEPYALAGLGDANGDGLDDLVVGGDLLEGERATVVFGAPVGAVHLGRPRSRGILLRASPCEALGGAVAPAGDVNGDGLADALVASELWCRHLGPYGTPAAYVLLGGAPAVLDAAHPGDRALRIAADRVDAIAGVGDQDGDGRDDLAIASARTLHLVRGRAEPGAISLRTLGAGGRRVRVAQRFDGGIDALAAVPDANGDGKPEIAMALGRRPFAGRDAAGAVIVAFSPLLGG